MKEKQLLQVHEAVRKRPGMYFGDEESAGNQLLYELLSNACDQCLADKAKKIIIKISDKSILIEDDGEGMPFDLPATEVTGLNSLVEQYMTQRIDKPTADGHAPHMHLGFFRGLGLCVASAVCKSFVITSVRHQVTWRQTFSRGVIESKAEILNDDWHNLAKGTRIEAIIDEEIFPNQCFDMPQIRRDIFEVCHLFPKLDITLNAEVFAPKNGLLDLAMLYGFTNSTIHFNYHGIEAGVEINVACVEHEYSKTNATQFYSWANGLRTNLGGSHVNGLQSALKANEFIPNTALISVLFHDAKYASPTREELASKKAEIIVEKVLTKAIADWKSNP